MTLQEISKLNKGTYRVIDRNQELHAPLKWDNVIHIIYQNKHKAVRRYSAFLHGLCSGSKDPFPAVPERGGLRQNCGRKAVAPETKKEQVTIGVRQSVIDSFGGKPAVKNILINHLKSLL